MDIYGSYGLILIMIMVIVMIMVMRIIYIKGWVFDYHWF